MARIKRRPLQLDTTELFCRCFHEGDQVVILTDGDLVYGGRFAFDADADHFVLSRNGKERTWKWHEITFMAHDGFPIKRVMGSAGSVTTADLEIIRSTIAAREGNETLELALKRGVALRTSDPYQLEPHTAGIVNAGPVGNFSNSPDEETLVMKSRDGAWGMLWGLGVTFDWCLNVR